MQRLLAAVFAIALVAALAVSLVRPTQKSASTATDSPMSATMPVATPASDAKPATAKPAESGKPAVAATPGKPVDGDKATAPKGKCPFEGKDGAKGGAMGDACPTDGKGAKGAKGDACCPNEAGSGSDDMMVKPGSKAAAGGGACPFGGGKTDAKPAAPSKP